MKKYEGTYTVALVGNPNVGKSTVFNSFTGLHQHTGNWSGKTVETAGGEYIYHNSLFKVQDLPGTYSMTPNSAEEEVTCDYIKAKEYDVLVIILDASCLERNIRFASQILQSCGKAVVCVNLVDEATKKGIEIDFEKLSAYLEVPVVASAARSGKGLKELKAEIEKTACETEPTNRTVVRNSETFARIVCNACCKHCKGSTDELDRKLDNLLISKKTGVPIMLLILAGIFWLTIVGANYPSQALSSLFVVLGEKLRALLVLLNCPSIIISAVMDGIYNTLTWIIAVMLPPMAIFFPLFTLMEDCGYLPRIAFNMDTYMKRAGAHGKQSLTIAMGFGCNACGVTGCRIIDSKRERLIAIITNSLVPCNGRFPILTSIISIFFLGTLSGAAATVLEAGVLLLLIILSIFITLVCSKFLSKTLLKGEPSSFILELPPYRKPQIGKVIVRSIFDRTLFVLFRAIIVAAPAGLFIWILANVNVGDCSVLSYCTEFLDPLGKVLGIDGAIVMAFLLGLPANEVVLPIILMIYLSQSSLTEVPNLIELKNILTANGWTLTTAICTLIFVLFHFPCSTTLITIYKETKSIKWTAVSFVLPLITGTIICLIINLISTLIQCL